MANIITIEGRIGGGIFVEGVTASSIENQIKEFGPTAAIDFEINSPGGNVFQGIKIHNLIKKHQGPTTTTAIGEASSIASYILMAGDKRRAWDNATVMIHNAGIGFNPGGDHNFLRKLANITEGLTKLMARRYSEASKKPESKTIKMMNDETWLFGQKILDEGFVDEIIPTGSEPIAESEAIALAQASFKACQEEMKIEASQNTDELVALVNNFQLTDIAASRAAKQKDPDTLGKRGEPMNREQFLAFLATNAEAKAFYDAQAKDIVDFENVTLKDLLEKAPVAKADHTKALADARTTAEVGKVTKEQINFVAVAISSEAYGASIKKAGTKVLTGEKDFSSFEDLVALADEQNEKFKSLQVKGSQPGKTPAENHDEGKMKEQKVLTEAQALGAKYGTATATVKAEA